MSIALNFTNLSFGSVNIVMETLSSPRGEDDPIVASCVSNSFDEGRALSYWCYLAAIADPGSLLLDVGAYAGLFAILAAKINPRIRVAAFEASALSYGRLVRNVLLNRLEARICAANLGVWKERGTINFDHHSGIYSMSPGTSAVREFDSVDYTESVHTFALDELLDVQCRLPGPLGSRSLGITDAKHISAIKIDVEGAELEVLTGSAKLVDEMKPVIICELLSREALAKAREFAETHNYVVQSIEGDRRNFILCSRAARDRLADGFGHWSQSNAATLELMGERRIMIKF